MIKKFKTYEEQLEILKKKNLILDIDCLNILKRNNYYFLINRYRNPFIEKDTKPVVFKKNAKFSEIVSLCEFDRELRNCYFKYILNVENVIKSIVSYEFSQQYSYEYLNEDSYDENSKKYLNDLFSNIKSAIKNGVKENDYMHHYNQNYSKFPLWVIVNNFSLGVTIKFYRNLKIDLRNKVASYFNLDEKELLDYLFIISYFRNQIAHNQRFYDLVYNGCNVMGLYDILSKLLTSNDSKNLKEEIKAAVKVLDDSVSSVSISDILGGYLLW